MSGVIVGKYRGRYLTAKGQQFILLAAPTRSGKGVGVVIPNLLNYPDSVVVFDLKLENFRFTSAFRAHNGQKVFLFAPFSEDRHTHRWNMLDTVSRDRHFRVGDILAIGQVFYPGDCDPREKFWNDNARNLFLGFALYLLETPELPCTLGEIFRQSSGKGKPLKDHIQGFIATRARGSAPLSEECLDAFGRFLSSPENTLGNIISTFNAPLLVFANPLVDAATSASDFDIRLLRKEPTSLYIGIQPARLSDAALLVNMLFSQIINVNTRELPENNPDLKYQCLLILDEFASLGKVNIIAKANAYISGYNVRLLTIIQSVSQLEAIYGLAETRTLVTNHALQILYPPREQKDAKEYSEMLGYLTLKSVSTGTSRPRAFGQPGSSSENVSDQRRALMLPQELKEMSPSQQIIMMENTKPILCEKAYYFEDARFVDRLKTVSACLAGLDRVRPPNRHPFGWMGFRSSRVVGPTEPQLKHAAFVLQELSVPVPMLDIKLHNAKVEQRTRPLVEGEPIDLSKLAFDVSGLPAFDDSDVPSAESVAKVVDAFFKEVCASDLRTDPYDEEIAPSSVGTRSATSGNTDSAAPWPAPSVIDETAGTNLGGAIDLSALDQ